MREREFSDSGSAVSTGSGNIDVGSGDLGIAQLAGVGLAGCKVDVGGGWSRDLRGYRFRFLGVAVRDCAGKRAGSRRLPASEVDDIYVVVGCGLGNNILHICIGNLRRDESEVLHIKIDAIVIAIFGVGDLRSLNVKGCFFVDGVGCRIPADVSEGECAGALGLLAALWKDARRKGRYTGPEKAWGI